jgi:hypothetical protein
MDCLSATAVLQSLYAESKRSGGFFLKKKPSRTQLESERVLENRSSRVCLSTSMLLNRVEFAFAGCPAASRESLEF